MADKLIQPHGPCFPDLKGKIALVTGGGHGIGRGLSLRLGEEGMHVVLCGRTESKLIQTADDVIRAGGTATPIVCDVSVKDDVAAMFERIAKEVGPLDTLVHNAALVDRKSLMDTDWDYWRKMFATNIDSAYFLGRHSAEMMIPRRTGTMIFISTIGVLRAHHKMIAYDASKGALDTFTRSLALEMAPHNIRVNAVAPGATLGRDPERLTHAEWKRRNELSFDPEINVDDISQPYIPMGRMGTPFEMAGPVAFLASNQSSYITGVVLDVDGGASAQISPPKIWI